MERSKLLKGLWRVNQPPTYGHQIDSFSCNLFTSAYRTTISTYDGVCVSVLRLNSRQFSFSFMTQKDWSGTFFIYCPAGCQISFAEFQKVCVQVSSVSNLTVSGGSQKKQRNVSSPLRGIPSPGESSPWRHSFVPGFLFPSAS